MRVPYIETKLQCDCLIFKLFIAVNRNIPVFDKSVYDVTITSATTPDEPIVKLVANDADASTCLPDDVSCPCADVKYTISYGNENDRFRIDTRTGEIFLTSRLTNEISQRYARDVCLYMYMPRTCVQFIADSVIFLFILFDVALLLRLLAHV